MERKTWKDRENKARESKTHDPKVEYDRRNHDWFDEQDIEGYDEEIPVKSDIQET